MNNPPAFNSRNQILIKSLHDSQIDKQILQDFVHKDIKFIYDVQRNLMEEGIEQ